MANWKEKDFLKSRVSKGKYFEKSLGYISTRKPELNCTVGAWPERSDCGPGLALQDRLVWQPLLSAGIAGMCDNTWFAIVFFFFFSLLMLSQWGISHFLVSVQFTQGLLILAQILKYTWSDLIYSIKIIVNDVLFRGFHRCFCQRGRVTVWDGGLSAVYQSIMLMCFKYTLQRCYKKEKNRPRGLGVVAHTCRASTWEVQSGIPGQPLIHTQ